MSENKRKWRTISVRTQTKLSFNRLKSEHAEREGRELNDDEFMLRLLKNYAVSSTTLRPNKVLPVPMNTSASS